MIAGGGGSSLRSPPFLASRRFLSFRATASAYSPVAPCRIGTTAPRKAAGQWAPRCEGLVRWVLGPSRLGYSTEEQRLDSASNSDSPRLAWRTAGSRSDPAKTAPAASRAAG